MKEFIVEQVVTRFAELPSEWVVFVLSMIPITELRAAIPIGLTVFGLSIPTTWIFAVLGNMAPTIFLIAGLPYLHDWVLRQPFIRSEEHT